MKRTTSLLLALFFCIMSAWAQSVVKGRVVDAQAGEPLPYAKIMVNGAQGTLTNVDGDFLLHAPAGATLRFSCVGYNAQTLRTNEVKKDVRLQPMTHAMNELTVRGINTNMLVRKVIRQLSADYKQWKSERQLYFYRTVLDDGNDYLLIEAFMKANSAVNLRRLKLVSGIKGFDAEVDDDQQLSITNTNIHHLVEIAPRAYNTPRWNVCIKPFDKASATRKYFRTTAEYLKSDAGDDIIRVEFRWKDPKKKIEGKSMMEGTAYVSASDYRLLRFDGNLLNQFMRSGLSRVPERLTFHLEYDYSRGFAELSTLTFEGGGVFKPNMLSTLSTINYRTVLFRVQDGDKAQQKEHTMQWDLLASIEKAGYNSQLWDEYEVIKRTEREESIAFGENSLRNSRMSRQHKYAYTPHIDTTSNKSLAALVRRQTRFASFVPQEKVFIHMDNTSYFQGDTIWFSAYTVQTNTDRPSNTSRVLYAELYNHDGYLVERKLIYMDGGRGSGFFALNKEHAYSGFYELRAYTRWQLNWGVFDHPHSYTAHRWFISQEMEDNYYRDYEKLYSRVFPVYDRPKSAETPAHIMTLRPLRRPKHRQEERQLRLSLYPEGGNLVADVPCRVAFEAAWSDGEVPATLPVDNQHRTALTVDGKTVLSQGGAGMANRGRGVFTVTPRWGHRTEVELTTTDGKRVKAHLPEPLKQGGTLSVEADSSDWLIHSRLTPDVDPSHLGISVSHEGKVYAFFAFHEGRRAKADGTYRFTFHAPRHVSGVFQATLFTDEGQVLSDRLFFHRAENIAAPTLTVEGLKEEYDPLERIQLHLQATDTTKVSGTLASVAIRDTHGAASNYDNASIMAELLLSSEIRGFVPQPDWFFQTDDEERRQALDLLMMTQGWRRFEWTQLAVAGEWQQTQPKEKAPMLMGRVVPLHDADPRLKLTYQASVDLHPYWQQTTEFRYEIEKKPKNKRKAAATKRDSLRHEYMLHALARDNSGDEMEFNDMRTKDRGHFLATMPSFYGDCMLHMGATPLRSYKPSTPYKWKEMLDPEYLTTKELRHSEIAPAPYQVLIDYHYPRFIRPLTFYQKTLMPLQWKDTGALPELANVTTMKELSVKGGFGGKYQFSDAYPSFMVDDHEALNNIIDAGMYYSPDLVAHTYFGDMGLGTWTGVVRGLHRNVNRNVPSDNEMRIQHYIPKDNLAGKQKDKGHFLAPAGDEESTLAHYLANEQEYHFNIMHRYGASPEHKMVLYGMESPDDSLYTSPYLKSISGLTGMTPQLVHKLYTGLGALDKRVVYTDYCPRLEGDERFFNDFPDVYVVDYPTVNGGQYPVYCDRFFRLQGFALPVEFYSPDYSQHALPDGEKDYRRTLYWNPALPLDKDGRATITLYNNSRISSLDVDAAGITPTGTLLYTR